MPTTNLFTALPSPKKMPFLGMMLLQEGECPYFDDRRPTLTAISAPAPLADRQFAQALESGMRRSGSLIYRPLCQGCRKCLPLRIKVSEFKPTSSQMRVLKHCDSLFVPELEAASLNPEKVELYRRYQAIKHHEILSGDEASEAYERFLVDSCVETKELRWRTREGRLVGVGLLDFTGTALSSVYFYWDPDFASFSLGTFSVIKEIELARELGLLHYYLGYFVPGSASMEYKIHFGPAEIFNGKSWEPLVSKKIHDPNTYLRLAAIEEGNTKNDAKRFDIAKSFKFETIKLP